MVDGIMARVGSHSEVETLAQHAKVPVINALSDLYHPTQTLASLLTLARVYAQRTATVPHFSPPSPPSAPKPSSPKSHDKTSSHTKPPQKTSWNTLWARQGDTSKPNILTPLQGLKVAWVGDCNNVVNDMIVTYPRLGIDLRVASPGGKGGEYGLDKRVEAKLSVPSFLQCPLLYSDLIRNPFSFDRREEFGLKHAVTFTDSPEEALKDADIVVTDTWISMGQEAESAKRVKDFAGFQVTEGGCFSLFSFPPPLFVGLRFRLNVVFGVVELCKRAGANPDWKFMHCLPRHKEEVDDEVFYGPRSTVFEEAENRKYTIGSIFK